MTEKQLRDDLRDVLTKDGWIVWFARRMKFVPAQDIITLYDGIAFKGSKMRLIQFTTKSNKSSHLTKIMAYKKLYALTHESELWLWNQKIREWEIFYI